MKYRMYIDEVGNPDLRASENPNHRYLSLTAVIMELGYVQSTAHPRIEQLKRRYFHSHPDEPVILHRKEIVNRKRPFESLRDAETERAFNADLLRLLQETEYVVLSVVIDKLEHRQRYQVWRYDPYHYCLAVLVERYIMWLTRRGTIGDVMAESRGGKEDRRLKESFTRLYREGSDYLNAEQFEARLTSGQLKVKPKQNNIAGLQIADVIAHPIYKAMIAERNQDPLPKTFGSHIYQILLEKKFDRSPSGRIDGWGKKWLP